MTVEQIDFSLRSVCDEVRSILQAQVAQRALIMSLAYDATIAGIHQGLIRYAYVKSC